MTTLESPMASLCRSALAGILLAVLVRDGLAGQPRADDGTPIEHVTKKPKGSDTLSTVHYKPSKGEQPSFEKLGSEEEATGGFSDDYDITSKDGKYVGWFGIVREVAEDAAARKTTLTIEHKYFDGLTDGQLVAELETDDDWAQYQAAEAIAVIGHDAKQAGPALRALLTHRDFNLRRAAALALEKIEPETTRERKQQ